MSKQRCEDSKRLWRSPPSSCTPQLKLLKSMSEYTIFVMHKSHYRTLKRDQRLPGDSTVRLGRAAAGTARCRYQTIADQVSRKMMICTSQNCVCYRAVEKMTIWRIGLVSFGAEGRERLPEIFGG